MKKKQTFLVLIAFFITVNIFAQAGKKYTKIDKRNSTGSGNVSNYALLKGTVSGVIIFSRQQSELTGFGMDPSNIKVYEVTEVRSPNSAFSVAPMALGRLVSEAVVKNETLNAYNNDTLCNYTISNLPLNKKIALVYIRYPSINGEHDYTQEEITNSAKKYSLQGAFFDCNTILNDSRSLMTFTTEKNELQSNIIAVKYSSVKVH